MTVPLYFPNVYIKEDTLDILARLFEAVSVYSVTASREAVSDPAGDMGIIQFIIPEYNDVDEFNEFLSTGFNSKPLYAPERAFQLTAELQKRVDDASFEENSEVPDKYRLMRARIFLQMAHEYDMQSRLIQQELFACKVKEQELIKELQGFEELDIKADVGEQDEIRQPDTSDFQIDKRFEAWIDIFHKTLEETEKSGDGFFITDNKSLMETIIEFESELELVCSINSTDTDKTELAGLIAQLKTCDWKTESERMKNRLNSKNDTDNENMTLYIVPGKEPADFFRTFASVNTRGKLVAEHREIKRNIVIGYIDI